MPENENIISTPMRIVIGAMAGIIAAIVKFYGAEFNDLFGRYALPNANLLISTVLISYFILAIILSIVGAFCAFLNSDETSKIKLVAVAMSAPAIFNSYYSGGFENENTPAISQVKHIEPKREYNELSLLDIFFIKRAVADTGQIKDYSKRTRIDDLGSGFSYILRIGERKCWIVVGSLKKYDDAVDFRKKIQEIDSKMGPFVGIKSNGFYPVLVGGFLPETEARNLLARANKIPLISNQNPFLSGC
ncbi:SPOR domain-containing protein [uncultured Nisaea sp.]|uniref:SPOR domain-containing protein n=1 Tax=uncultured Nisaea sp. TaxID=538215 RepID=UPI0030EF8500|tara:strand:+ start:713 stop:1453 length:741 start_codon:yes stop_codon:yes gene_type:complete